jgi:hypothetical protein
MVNVVINVFSDCWCPQNWNEYIVDGSYSSWKFEYSIWTLIEHFKSNKKPSSLKKLKGFLQTIAPNETITT